MTAREVADAGANRRRHGAAPHQRRLDSELWRRRLQGLNLAPRAASAVPLFLLGAPLGDVYTRSWARARSSRGSIAAIFVGGATRRRHMNRCALDGDLAGRRVNCTPGARATTNVATGPYGYGRPQGGRDVPAIDGLGEKAILAAQSARIDHPLNAGVHSPAWRAQTITHRSPFSQIIFLLDEMLLLLSPSSGSLRVRARMRLNESPHPAPCGSGQTGLALRSRRRAQDLPFDAPTQIRESTPTGSPRFLTSWLARSAF